MELIEIVDTVVRWVKIVGGTLLFVALFVLVIVFRQRIARVLKRFWHRLEGPFVYVTFPLVRRLAEREIFFFPMEEGTMAVTVRGGLVEPGPKTGKPIVKKGAFAKAYIQWEGYTLSKRAGTDADGNQVAKWDVVPDGTVVGGQVQQEPHHPYGGIRSYLWPLERVKRYEFAWIGVDINGNIQVHPPEVLSYIFAREDIYRGELFEVEDANRLHIDLAFLVRIRVINAYKALFKIENWLEAVLNRARPLVRKYVATNTYEEIHAAPTEAGGEVWQALVDTGRITEFRSEYGVEIPDGGIDFTDIEPPEDYRAVTLIEWQAKQERKGVEVKAGAERARIGILGLRGLFGRILDKFGR